MKIIDPSCIIRGTTAVKRTGVCCSVLSVCGRLTTRIGVKIVQNRLRNGMHIVKVISKTGQLMVSRTTKVQEPILAEGSLRGKSAGASTIVKRQEVIRPVFKILLEVLSGFRKTGTTATIAEDRKDTIGGEKENTVDSFIGSRDGLSVIWPVKY